MQPIYQSHYQKHFKKKPETNWNKGHVTKLGITIIIQIIHKNNELSKINLNVPFYSKTKKNEEISFLIKII